jgi:hypothetical protein
MSLSASAGMLVAAGGWRLWLWLVAGGSPRRLLAARRLALGLVVAAWRFAARRLAAALVVRRFARLQPPARAPRACGSRPRVCVCGLRASARAFCGSRLRLWFALAAQRLRFARPPSVLRAPAAHMVFATAAPSRSSRAEHVHTPAQPTPAGAQAGCTVSPGAPRFPVYSLVTTVLAASGPAVDKSVGCGWFRAR